MISRFYLGNEELKTSFQKAFENFLQTLFNINENEQNCIESLYAKNSKLLQSNLRSEVPTLSLIKVHLQKMNLLLER